MLRNRRLTMTLATALVSIILMAAAGCATYGSPGQTPAVQNEITYPPYDGPKKRIAVLEFDNDIQGHWWDRSWNISRRLTDMVTTELMKTNRFIVVERGALDEILAEQDLGSSGRIRRETAAKVGELLGAQVLIKGAVTEFAQKESGGIGGLAIHGIGIVGRTDTGHVAIDLKLIDSTTGQVQQSHRSEGRIKSTGFGGIAFFHGLAFGGAAYNKTALGKATRQAVQNAVSYIVNAMDARPWEGRVVKATGGTVYVNGGANMNITTGTIFSVYSKGDELIDPDTGLSLGSVQSRAGTIRVTQVMEKFSVAETLEGSGFKRGDILKLQ